MNAIIIAAGFGSRMLPVTRDIPKPLVSVNGTRFIDTTIRGFLGKGIEDIYIVRGYNKEMFDVLKKDYPSLHFIDNDDYDKGNNILSILRVLPYLGDSFISEADLYLSNPDLIDPHASSSYYLARKVKETDDWCFDLNDKGYLGNYRKGGKDCYLACGLSFWPKKDTEKIKRIVPELLKEKENWNLFWDFVPFGKHADEFQVSPHPFKASDIVEIDTFDELCQADPSYLSYAEKK